MSLKSLKAACPAAHDTVLYGYESQSPAVLFPFDGMTVLAVQHGDSLLPERPADSWSVRGSNALLLGRLPLSAPWVEVRDALGSGIVSTDNASTDQQEVTVMFCAHPRLVLRCRGLARHRCPGQSAGDLESEPVAHPWRLQAQGAGDLSDFESDLVLLMRHQGPPPNMRLKLPGAHK